MQRRACTAIAGVFDGLSVLSVETGAQAQTEYAPAGQPYYRSGPRPMMSYTPRSYSYTPSVPRYVPPTDYTSPSPRRTPPPAPAPQVHKPAPTPAPAPTARPTPKPTPAPTPPTNVTRQQPTPAPTPPTNVTRQPTPAPTQPPVASRTPTPAPTPSHPPVTTPSTPPSAGPAHPPTTPGTPRPTPSTPPTAGPAHPPTPPTNTPRPPTPTPTPNPQVATPAHPPATPPSTPGNNGYSFQQLPNGMVQVSRNGQQVVKMTDQQAHSAFGYNPPGGLRTPPHPPGHVRPPIGGGDPRHPPIVDHRRNPPGPDGGQQTANRGPQPPIPDQDKYKFRRLPGGMVHVNRDGQWMRMNESQAQRAFGYNPQMAEPMEGPMMGEGGGPMMGEGGGGGGTDLAQILEFAQPIIERLLDGLTQRAEAPEGGEEMEERGGGRGQGRGGQQAQQAEEDDD